MSQHEVRQYGTAVVVRLSTGHLEEHGLELLTERGQGRRRSDTKWQIVPGTSSSH